MIGKDLKDLTSFSNAKGVKQHQYYSGTLVAGKFDASHVLYQDKEIYTQ